MRSGLSVIVLSNVPNAVRGYASVYFVELGPGIYAGRVSKDVRERLWDKLLSSKRLGSATLIYTDDSEQGFRIETHDGYHRAQDFDGVTLIERQAFNRAVRLGTMRLSDEIEFLLSLEN